MKYIILKNKSNQKIDFSKLKSLLNHYWKLVPKEKYPLKIVVLKKKSHFDRSSFNLDTNELTLKFDTSKQSNEEILWVTLHEFFHFVQNNNKELKKTCLSNEFIFLEELLMTKFKLPREKVHEVWHDVLPPEVVSNFMATLLIGKFYQRHSFKNIEKYINK